MRRETVRVWAWAVPGYGRAATSRSEFRSLDENATRRCTASLHGEKSSGHLRTTRKQQNRGLQAGRVPPSFTRALLMALLDRSSLHTVWSHSRTPRTALHTHGGTVVAHKNEAWPRKSPTRRRLRPPCAVPSSAAAGRQCGPPATRHRRRPPGAAVRPSWARRSCFG